MSFRSKWTLTWFGSFPLFPSDHSECHCARGPILGKGNSHFPRKEWDSGFTMLGTFKMDHLHPFRPILLKQIFNFFTFILGSHFLLPQRANNGIPAIPATQADQNRNRDTLSPHKTELEAREVLSLGLDHPVGKGNSHKPRKDCDSEIRGLPLSTSAIFFGFLDPLPPRPHFCKTFVRKIGRFWTPLPPRLRRT